MKIKTELRELRREIEELRSFNNKIDVYALKDGKEVYLYSYPNDKKGKMFVNLQGSFLPPKVQAAFENAA